MSVAGCGRAEPKLQFFYCLAKRQYGVLPYIMTCVRRCRSSPFVRLAVKKGGSRISRERFDLKSPHSTRTFMPVGSISTPDTTSLATYGSQLSKFTNRSKMQPPTASRGISGKWFKRGSRNFTRLPRTTRLTNLPDVTSLAFSGRLQNAIKEKLYCSKLESAETRGRWRLISRFCNDKVINAMVIRPLDERT